MCLRYWRILAQPFQLLFKKEFLFNLNIKSGEFHPFSVTVIVCNYAGRYYTNIIAFQLIYFNNIHENI